LSCLGFLLFFVFLAEFLDSGELTGTEPGALKLRKLLVLFKILGESPIGIVTNLGFYSWEFLP